MSSSTTKKLKAGYIYTVTATTSCTVSTEDGLVITTVEPGTQGTFVAPAELITFSDPDALVTASFKGASVAVSGGGGGTGSAVADQTYSAESPRAQSGVAVAQAISQVDTRVVDYGIIPAALDLSGYEIDTDGRAAATDEIWFEFIGRTYQITWPDSWIWLDGEEPVFNTDTAYCICVRQERSGRTIANLAYGYEVPTN